MRFKRGRFLFPTEVNPMNVIQIIAMCGELPCIVAHMLLQSASISAKDFHFRHGVITPLNLVTSGSLFSLTPGTIFNCHDVWFALTDIVNAIRSPEANDDYDPVYYTDGVYYKVTNGDTGTQGSGDYPQHIFAWASRAPQHAQQE